MMFKKWHTTGRNKKQRILSALLALALAVGAPMISLPAVAEESGGFTDMDPNAWYFTEAMGSYEAGLFQGTAANEFSPMGIMSREQFVTAVARLCGVTAPTNSGDYFTDVPQTWSYHFIYWAYDNGLVGGRGNGIFDPLAPITRQEMCKLMGAAIEFLEGAPLSTENAKVFSDGDQIADWAKEWVDKCSANGLVNGTTDAATGQTVFNPLNTTTRAEGSCLFHRQYENGLIKDLKVSGFDLDFDPEQDYYVCYTENFDDCRILGLDGLGKMTVSVEQYATHFPYKNTPYEFNTPLKLGNGRAKITLTFAGSDREYLITITDPDATDYAYAKARVSSTVNMRTEPNTSSEVIVQLWNNARVYYLKTLENGWCMVEQLYSGKIGYIHGDYLRWGWLETQMPQQYANAITALQTAHPNWSFSFVDMEMTYAAALTKEYNAYGNNHETYLNPANYLAEDKIFAFLDIDTYDPTTWNDAGIAAIWTNEKAISKATAVEYFNEASKSLLMNPYYIACRGALETGYGTSKFATGQIPGYEGYYNFFGIQCYDRNPTVGAEYAKSRNWNSVFRSVVEGANWVKDQYLDQGAITPYFFRYNGFQNKIYMTDAQAPLKEASILKRAFTDPNAKAHFIIPVYRELP